MDAARTNGTTDDVVLIEHGLHWDSGIQTECHPRNSEELRGSELLLTLIISEIHVSTLDFVSKVQSLLT